MRTLTSSRIPAALIAFFFIAALVANAQTYTTLTTFNGANGDSPFYVSLVQGANGNFYGTTVTGGDIATSCSNGQGFDCGTVFELTPGGNLTTIYTFCAQDNCADGLLPYSGLTLGRDGNFYGTTSLGGTLFGEGTIYKVTPTGQLTTLYSFCSQLNCTDGSYPIAGVVQASNGNFYGTTLQGGAYNQGVVYQVSPGGTYKVLHSFCALTNCTDGSAPFAGLMQASNGALYGTTSAGGAHGAGTVFAITPSGKFQTLHSFDFTDGSGPTSVLLQTSNGAIYGTTVYGGLRNDGTVFQMTTAGALKTIYNFCVAAYCSDGANPAAGLIAGANGGLYGTTQSGGMNLRGNIFEMTPSGRLKTIYSFCSQTNCADGDTPFAAVVQASDGTLYGTTYLGGDLSCEPPTGCGVVFSLTQ
ncbi:MAG TPA: choice-of-anchor tandem repeat GloVer-containing protein [Candidatus Sulfotelmatobacter sp.]|nr:choice-of-anchor tandem repeat GloVer-containing protein [Candidatus Sulfotelmatobacter sp.]